MSQNKLVDLFWDCVFIAWGFSLLSLIIRPFFLDPNEPLLEQGLIVYGIQVVLSLGGGVLVGGRLVYLEHKADESLKGFLGLGGD